MFAFNATNRHRWRRNTNTNVRASRWNANNRMSARTAPRRWDRPPKHDAPRASIIYHESRYKEAQGPARSRSPRRTKVPFGSHRQARVRQTRTRTRPRQQLRRVRRCAVRDTGRHAYHQRTVRRGWREQLEGWASRLRVGCRHTYGTPVIGPSGTSEPARSGLVSDGIFAGISVLCPFAVRCARASRRRVLRSRGCCQWW